ncbi:MAG: murein hydrolase activator EnvC family protein [Gaiellaceae bacterium]
MPRNLLALAAAVASLALAPLASAHTSGAPELSFVWPAQGTITSPFGQDGARWHSGLDIGVLRELAVTAAASGYVTGVGEQRGFEGYGNVVTVDAGDGYMLLYAHLASWSVQVGDYVGRGAAIGIAGCTGWCTGTHLHFELREDGQAISPLPYLPTS